MQRLKLGHKIAAVLLVLVVVVGTVYINDHSKNAAASKAVVPIKTVTPNLNLAFGAWLPYWDNGSGLTSFKANAKSISEISPFFYQATSATNIERQGNSSFNTSVQTAIKKTNSANIPTLTETLNTSDFTAMVNDSTQVAAHSQAVCDWVVSNNFAGVNIDYETFFVGLTLQAAPILEPRFTALMASMASCLHQHKKVLEVTVLPRTNDPRYAYFESHLSVSVFNYAEIGRVADYIIPMAYDFSYPGSNPGSTDPIDWVKAVVKFTTDRVDASKVQLALPLYGYNWVTKGASTTAANAKDVAARYGVTPTRDVSTQSMVYTYVDSSQNLHTVWYDDAQATALRVQVARDAGLHGVVFWTIGDEEPNSFQTIIKGNA